MFDALRVSLSPFAGSADDRNIFFREYPQRSPLDWRVHFDEPSLLPEFAKAMSHEEWNKPTSFWNWILMHSDILVAPTTEIMNLSRLELPVIPQVPENPRDITNRRLNRLFGISVPYDVNIDLVKNSVIEQASDFLMKLTPADRAEKMQRIVRCLRKEREAIPLYMAGVEYYENMKESYTEQLTIKQRNQAIVERHHSRVLTLRTLCQRWYKEGHPWHHRRLFTLLLPGRFTEAEKQAFFRESSMKTAAGWCAEFGVAIQRPNLSLFSNHEKSLLYSFWDWIVLHSDVLLPLPENADQVVVDMREDRVRLLRGVCQIWNTRR